MGLVFYYHYFLIFDEKDGMNLWRGSYDLPCKFFPQYLLTLNIGKFYFKIYLLNLLSAMARSTWAKNALVKCYILVLSYIPQLVTMSNNLWIKWNKNQSWLSRASWKHWNNQKCCQYNYNFYNHLNLINTYVKWRGCQIFINPFWFSRSFNTWEKSIQDFIRYYIIISKYQLGIYELKFIKTKSLIPSLKFKIDW